MRPFIFSDMHSRSDGPQTRFLAGGTTLVDLMKLDVETPEQVVDLNRAEKDLSKITASEKGLRFGALVRMSEAAAHEDVRENYPVIAQSLELAASQQVRNMASLGGNV